MENKNNREKVICFRVDKREERVLNKLMELEERPGVGSPHKYARTILVEYLAANGKKLIET